MSIKLMTEVWEHADAKGSELLLLLAIADFANDDGHAFPAMETLARKTRLSKRNVQYLVCKLEDTGLLRVDKRCGRKRCNLFTIVLEKVKASVVKGESQRKKGAIAIAPYPSLEPSLTKEENSRLLERGKRFLTPGGKAHAEIYA